MNTLVLWTHIACGALLLILGLIQIALRKGGNRHRKLGNGYVVLMLWVCMSALFISAQKILEINSAGHVFLFVIALFSQYAVFSGFLMAKFKSNRNIFLGKVLVVYGWLVAALLLLLTFAFWNGLGWICAVFTLLQLAGVVQDTKYYFFKSSNLKNGDLFWLFSHAGRMMGSYIAAVTAFLVNVVHCPYPLVLWLGPTVIGTPLIFWFNARLKRKYTSNPRQL